MDSKKTNIWLAFLLSLLTALAGSVVFGIIYGLGYYIYILAALEIVLACKVFFKFKPATNWKVVLLAIVWTVICTFIFNFIAILVCEAVWIAKEFSVSTAEAFNVLMELWQNEPEIKAYMNQRLLQIAAMIFIGGVIYGAYFGLNYAKTKKINKNLNQNTAVRQTVSNTTNATDLSNTYFNLFNSCKNSYLLFVKDKNKQAFKEKLQQIELTYVQPLNETDKSIIKQNLEKKLNNPNTSAEDKNVTKILLTLFK